MTDIDTHDADAVAGALYFVVGRGTEGGPSSFHLSVTGITVGTSDPHWGSPGKIIADSGYTLGTIQVDLGKRGNWALGSTDGSLLKPGETSYVGGVVEQSAAYAKSHDLKFTDDKLQLRTDLLSHGNGKDGRSTLAFIDTDTRDSINTWAGSEEGQKWIHKNVDYPQIKNATQSSMDLLDKYGKNIPDDRRLETLAILAKTENQIPSQVVKFEKVLKDGGNYDDVIEKANHIKNTYSYYDGPKAAAIAESYKAAHRDPERAAALDRANTKVGSENFNPKESAKDPDIATALTAIGQVERKHAAHGQTLQSGSHGVSVTSLQDNLTLLGYTDAHGRQLSPDGNFGPGTKAAVESFQRDNHMKSDGIVGASTLAALNRATTQQASLSNASNPGHTIYNQALDRIRDIDVKHGRTTDQASHNFAGSMTTAAQAEGLTRIDHIVMSDDNSRAYAIQGELNSPFKKIAVVDVARAVAVPLEESSAVYAAAAQKNVSQDNLQTLPEPTAVAQTTMPTMHR